MEDTLVEFINLISSLAPEVWTILIKQVQVEGASRLIWGVGLIPLSIFLIRFTIFAIKRAEKTYEYIVWQMLGTFGAVFSLLSIIIGFSLLTDAAMRLSNPEFYAIKILLSSIGGN